MASPASAWRAERKTVPLELPTGRTVEVYESLRLQQMIRAGAVSQELFDAIDSDDVREMVTGMDVFIIHIVAQPKLVASEDEESDDKVWIGRLEATEYSALSKHAQKAMGTSQADAQFPAESAGDVDRAGGQSVGDDAE